MTLEAKWFSLVFSWRQTNAKATHEENWKNESNVIKKKMDILIFFFLINDNRWTCLVVY